VWTAEVKRAVRRVAGVSGRCGQVEVRRAAGRWGWAGGVSGCKRWGSGGRCFRMSTAGGQVGGASG
jgi:hypothetical protein